MPPLNYQHFARLLEEQRSKRNAFNKQLQLELLYPDEPEIDKHLRQKLLNFLANRILQIDTMIDQWLDTVELDLDRLVE